MIVSEHDFDDVRAVAFEIVRLHHAASESLSPLLNEDEGFFPRSPSPARAVSRCECPSRMVSSQIACGVARRQHRPRGCAQVTSCAAPARRTHVAESHRAHAPAPAVRRDAHDMDDWLPRAAVQVSCRVARRQHCGRTSRLPASQILEQRALVCSRPRTASPAPCWRGAAQRIARSNELFTHAAPRLRARPRRHAGVVRHLRVPSALVARRHQSFHTCVQLAALIGVS
jgi:hypothetical protein